MGVQAREPARHGTARPGTVLSYREVAQLVYVSDRNKQFISFLDPV